MPQQQHLFPITLAGQWQIPPESLLTRLPDNLCHWLLDQGSLTARLKSHCQHFRVEVLGQQETVCSAVEANELIAVGEPILAREVILYCDDVAQVFARSLLPIASLTGDEQQLANLGTQPLGQVLFNNPSLIRQRIELASFSLETKVVKLARQLTKTNKQRLWGRRSVFMLENKPLMVAEVFLPDAFAYTTTLTVPQGLSKQESTEEDDAS
jgi:chorismate--pyruvate lyase